MSTRSEQLAARLEQGAAELANYAATLDAEAWSAIIPQEERSVGTLVHHVANMYPVEMNLAQLIASGQTVAGVTWALVADINANHAAEHTLPERKATVEFLHRNAAEAAAAVRAMTDAQLDTAVPNSLYGDAPLTLQHWLEDHPVSHSYKHLAAIKTFVATLQPA